MGSRGGIGFSFPNPLSRPRFAAGPIPPAPTMGAGAVGTGLDARGKPGPRGK